jgi:hypothetical protein
MDDDFNILGGLQRQANLKQNKQTRQEIAGLREDLRRREVAEAAAPKCPYCIGAISDGAVKCRHCASDIVWCEVQAKPYPMKSDADPQHFVEQKLKELAEENRQAERSRGFESHPLRQCPETSELPNLKKSY